MYAAAACADPRQHAEKILTVRSAGCARRNSPPQSPRRSVSGSLVSPSLWRCLICWREKLQPFAHAHLAPWPHSARQCPHAVFHLLRQQHLDRARRWLQFSPRSSVAVRALAQTTAPAAHRVITSRSPASRKSGSWRTVIPQLRGPSLLFLLFGCLCFSCSLFPVPCLFQHQHPARAALRRRMLRNQILRQIEKKFDTRIAPSYPLPQR